MRPHNLLFIPLLAVMLTGCGTIQKIACTVQKVEVPVIVKPPSPPVVNVPHLPIQDLTQKSDAGTTALSYKASIILLEGVIKQYQQILDKYTELSK